MTWRVGERYHLAGRTARSPDSLQHPRVQVPRVGGHVLGGVQRVAVLRLLRALRRVLPGAGVIENKGLPHG